MGENTLELSLLLDFFGDLLTEKQREYFEMYHNEDLSLSEIAENCGISRQAVHENISRAEASLREFEAKTGVVKKFTETQHEISRALKIADEIEKSSTSADVKELACRLKEILVNLKG